MQWAASIQEAQTQRVEKASRHFLCLLQVEGLQEDLGRERSARQQEQQAAASELASLQASYNQLQQRLQTANDLVSTTATEADKKVLLCPRHAVYCLSQLDSRRLSYAILFAARTGTSLTNCQLSGSFPLFCK